MFYRKKIHITPEDYLTKIDAYYDGQYSYIHYYIEPDGPEMINEMSDTYYMEGNQTIGCHEHTRGIETFMVDGGSVEISIRGKKAVIEKGDMVHIQSFMPHRFTWIEPGTIWREMFQATRMNDDMEDQERFKQFHDTEFDPADYGKGSYSYWYDFVPVCEPVSKYEIPEIRPFDYGLSEFRIGNLILRQKVGRWETRGVKEIWQGILPEKTVFSWPVRNPEALLLVVFKGSVRVELEGQEPFIARERDIIHIPNFLAGRIRVLEDSVLLDYNCQSYMLRAMEELKAYTAALKEGETADPEITEKILQKHRVYLRLEA